MTQSPDLQQQKDFYEEFHSVEQDLPVEVLKQEKRLEVLGELMRGRDFANVLVVGCGQGDEILLFDAAQIYALDLSRLAVRIARQKSGKTAFLVGDALNLPFPSQSFDAVLCSEVIEHVFDPSRLFDEVARVLRPQGSFFLSTPNWISWWGLARRLAEFALRRPVTSGGQPVDNWFTYRRLRAASQPQFDVSRRRGVWYYPPTGLGLKRFPDRWAAPLIKFLFPVDSFLSRAMPGMGHLHAVHFKRRA